VTDKLDNQSTFVERWCQEQQEWQKTILGYLDTMAKNEDFLVHLGNAMRGSLLAGKPYPSAAATDSRTDASQQAAQDNRLDQVLFALHQIQGQLQDLAMTMAEIRDSLSGDRKKRSSSRTTKSAIRG
jgi:hypothetical protein